MIHPQDQKLIDDLVNRKYPGYSRIREIYEGFIAWPSHRHMSGLDTLKNRILLDNGNNYEKKLNQKRLEELVELHESEDDRPAKLIHTKMEWIAYANPLGKKMAYENPLWNIEKIAGKVREHMITNKITGRGDRVPAKGTIMRRGLKGIKG